MVDEPAERAAIDAGLKDVYAALGVGARGHDDEGRTQPARPPGRRSLASRTWRPMSRRLAVIRSALAAHGLLEPASA